MSKLPKAPLLEVIFEINWDITNKNDIINFQYLHGDLYSNIKENYSYRENLLPPEVPYDVAKGMPVYRFRKEEAGYPLVQIGPGILTYNTVDELYFWESFENEINNLTKSFSVVFSEINKINLIPTLTYIDFFEIDLQNENIVDFVNQNLNLNVKQSIIENDRAKDINLNLSYEIDNNILSLNLRGGSANNKEGIVLQTKLIGKKQKYSSKEQIEWLNEAHEICSDIFKKITTEKLYNSFK
jgi:uncharacterized protein (TIGR04255 family)